MSIAVAAALAAAAAALLVALPRTATLRLEALRLEALRLEALRLEALRPGVPGAARARRPALPLIAVPLLALTVGPVLALLALVGGGVGWRWHCERTRRRERAAERRGAGEACAVLAAELRAGRAPADALVAAAEVAVGPLQSTLQAAGAAARLGGDVAATLRSPPAGQPPTAVPEALMALGACWSVCASSGSGLAAAVDRLEEGLRAEQDRRRAVAAELAGPRATAVLLALLPLAGLLLAAGLGADPLDVLLHTRIGLVCLVLGVGLDGLGLLWTSRLVDRAGGAA